MHMFLCDPKKKPHYLAAWRGFDREWLSFFDDVHYCGIRKVVSCLRAIHNAHRQRMEPHPGDSTLNRLPTVGKLFLVYYIRDDCRSIASQKSSCIEKLHVWRSLIYAHRVHVCRHNIYAAVYASIDVFKCHSSALLWAKQATLYPILTSSLNPKS